MTRKMNILAAMSAFVLLAMGFAHGFDQSVQMGLAVSVMLAIMPMLPAHKASFGGFRCDDPNTVLAAAIEKAFNNANSMVMEVKALGEELKAKYAERGTVTDGLKESVDKAMTELNEQKATVNDLLKKSASTAPTGNQIIRKSLGQSFVEDERVALWLKNRDSRSIKATITSALVNGGTAGHGLETPAYRDPDLVSLPRRQVLTDLIPVIPITSSSVEFAQQLTRNNNAAMVAEGAQKPYSDYSWGYKTVPVRTMAHLMKITRQAMDDAPRLMAELNSEGVYGLDLLQESQMLSGNGEGQNLDGILPQATAYANPAAITDPTKLSNIDVLRLAMLNISLRDWQANGMVLNVVDWAMIEMLKDTLGRYIISNPNSATNAPKLLWGLPVIATQAMAQDSFLVGDFQRGANLYSRLGTEILLSTENDTDFELNLATVRIERRIALAVKRPSAFETGTFTAAKTAPSGG